MKRSIFILLLQFIALLDTFSQCNETIFPLDTLTSHLQSSNRTWFKGNLDDTIIHYKSISIDSLIRKENSNEFDTVFLIQYFEKGWRYINGKLNDTDYKKQQFGYMYKSKINGLWDFTGSPSCFTNGSLSIEQHFYYNGVLLPGFFKDKYYFLNESINGFVMTNYSAIDTITESICYSCSINENGAYFCNISLKDGLFINQVSLENLKDESDLILSGYYNREIINKRKKHNR